MKTEPETFSIQDLAAAPRQSTCWEGVRNYQARNFMRDQMQVGDRVLVYHSGGSDPAVVGTATICRAAYPDAFAWDRRSPYFDPASSPDNPRWVMVDIRLEQIFAQPLGLARLRDVAALRQMELLRKESRLSVQPVKPEEFAAILQLAGVAVAS